LTIVLFDWPTIKLHCFSAPNLLSGFRNLPDHDITFAYGVGAEAAIFSGSLRLPPVEYEKRPEPRRAVAIHHSLFSANAARENNPLLLMICCAIALKIGALARAPV